MAEVTRTTARFVERGLVATRARVSQILDSVQLRLRVIDVSRDPEVRRWAADMRERAASGDLARRLAEQPDDPKEFVERFRRPEAP